MLTLIRSLWNFMNDPTWPDQQRRFHFSEKHAWLLYCALALVTFGYDARHYPTLDCHDKYHVVSPNDIPGVKPFFAGILWPLFWTWELAAPGTPPTCPLASDEGS